MEYVFTEALKFHAFFAYVFTALTLVLGGLVALRQTKKYVRRIRLFLPTYYAIGAAIFTTGGLLWAIQNFALNFGVIFMIFAFLGAIGLNAIGFKKLKIAYKTGDFRAYKFTLAKLLSSVMVLLIGACLV